MKRPSFQFYPGDWQANSNLRRCTRVEKSVWLDVLCLMHDQEEYGVLRWTLKEIAEAAHCKVSELKSLREKGVLKGADKGETCTPHIYVPRSGRKDGPPVTLIAEQDGPLWYSSRMVEDEHKRKHSGGNTRFVAGGGDAESEQKPPAAGSPSHGHGEGQSEGQGAPQGDELPPRQGDGASASSSSSPTVNTQTSVELALDGGEIGKTALTEAETIAGIFEYWKRATGQKKAQLGDKRIKVIRAALRWGYSPRDLCRAIQGCALTPHNQGVNDRGQKYLGLHVCLGSEDQIDRFMANSKAPPVAPDKRVSGQIQGWWKDDELAKQQAALVGVSGPHPTDSRDTWHARIRAAIENGGKPAASAAAIPCVAPAESAPPKVELTPEQIAERRAALLAVTPGLKFGSSMGPTQ
ncbi:hypothetical protein QYH69_34110 [Paraburkholderia sp. SARCC-3016]|uniref:hypothetical protein n=1 Tax=Paraburkholderia sp. SARCC-3016 TaxID=3058611 RepID=UPI0028075447|nr:hypothetical protein [Paraburkholderia sp. SARCC-3016]MDQ7982261.1 hypothetical protein [Paraburkholderia sp. SARCC-3016]